MSNISVKITGDKKSVATITNEDIDRVVNNSLKKLKSGLTNKLEIEIIFVDKDEIKALNKEHRQIDAPTDVLSFPQDQIKESLVNILGSIVICLPVVFEKEEDISDVIKHGLLHLLGYDHEVDEKTWEEAAKIIECDL